MKKTKFVAPFTENEFSLAEAAGGPNFIYDNFTILNRSFVTGPFVQVGPADTEQKKLGTLVGSPVIINLSPLGLIGLGYEENIDDAVDAHEEDTRILATIVDIMPGFIITSISCDYEFDEDYYTIPVRGKTELLPIRNEWIESIVPFEMGKMDKPKANVSAFAEVGIDKDTFDKKYASYVR